MRLTEGGADYVRERRELLGTRLPPAPVRTMMELRALIWQVGAAVREVVGTGTDEQHVQARAVLAETRRSLYRILAGDDPERS